MQDILAESIRILKRGRARRKRMIAILLVLSLLVSLDVFWFMRQPGLTLAGDADCRITEHTHDESCHSEEAPCALPEHVHTIACYADETADTETQLDWQKMFADYPYTDNLQQDLVGIAKTQVGYRESTENFQVDDSGIRHGYTRYGAWYGAPYGSWSAMFVSFCLHYAGADPEEFPGNTGAASMARLWETRGHYAAAGTYSPSPGDLVFFTDNTVGIVSEVQAATCNVIRGDADQAVVSETIAIASSAISGWGTTGMPPEIPEASQAVQEEATPPNTEVSQTELLDISNGPAFFIFAAEAGTPQTQGYSIRSTRTVTDLIAYLKDKNGSYFFTLRDQNNEPLPNDGNNNYTAIAGVGYKLTLSINSPNGFLPGTYQYQIPNGLLMDAGNGIFTLDGTDVGTWDVTDTGLITLVFNNNMNTRTEVTISATFGIHFALQDEPLNFDGLITVKVDPPPQQTDPTVLNKGGKADPETGKIKWTVYIEGHADSQILSNILADQVYLGEWSKPHTYTASDIAGGLSFVASSPDGNWHNWHVSPEDPHLVWDEDGWSYKIPHTVTCNHCGTLELGNNGWTYQVSYTSTPTPLGYPGTFGYENKVSIDGQTKWSWANFAHSELAAVVHKEGQYVADAAGGAFQWEVQAFIPGRKAGEHAGYNWTLFDEMRLLDENGTAKSLIHNDANLATVTATYNGTTITIPRIQDATANDLFAWDNAWSGPEGSAILGSRSIILLSRCQCTTETCHWTGCGVYWYTDDAGNSKSTSDFCQCWTETQDMTFTFIYRTTDLSLIEGYGPLGYQVNNRAQLSYAPVYNSHTTVSTPYVGASATIPNLFQKQLTHDFDGYTANYKITVNEARLVLTDGSPLYIHDVMTDTLAFMRGTLEVFTEDEFGNVVHLVENTDYTVTYDGSGTQTDANGKKVHVLDVTILHPQPVKYILDYDATLIMPDKVTEGIKYQNSAFVSLWGQKVNASTTEKIYADLNISARQYAVEIHKVDGGTGNPLAGATFGLFNDKHGGLIASATTDASGTLLFKTNIEDGIILREHELYYLQELQAPPGYQLDDTKHWFRFCNESGDTCSIYHDTPADTNIIRIPLGQNGHITVRNHLLHYDLPATGGSGVYPLLLVSVIFVITPLVYMSIRRRKRERRGVG